ncbi:cytochrome P450 family protein [Priestia taiwanensis]|uniref:Cytochrome P450 n=1 Tax=Priestia taiwanensis TaxID=1347902 RepID=A0A917AP57_9BACI|nr:cytochrome P450 [Priestia taiwanensis]MBM7362303.1 cytochrome P450 [Priestia taiwanensis]GGE61088.1 cytochrome P450 [Priestia taiwanensis]
MLLQKVEKGELLTYVDLCSAEFKHSSHEMYKEIRIHHPVCPVQFYLNKNAWLFTRYEDAMQMLKDPRISKDYHTASVEDEGEELLVAAGFEESEYLFNHMLNADPPNHTRLRAVSQKAFTPKAIARLEEKIRHIADDLLNKVELKQTINLVDDYSFPLPIIVICDLLGIPKEDRDKFRKWSNAIIDSSEDPEQIAENAILLKEFLEYLRAITAQKRQEPQEDLISTLIFAEEDGQRLNEKEIYSTLMLLIVAGHETTVNLITNTVLALLQHPDQFQLLKDNPSLLDSAIDESLRFYSPVELATERWASEAMTIHGQDIQKGDPIIVSIAAANRDERMFDNPDIFDITRKNNRHLSFGSGIHFCLGAMLAKLEAKIAVQTLINRFPSMQLAEKEVEWRGNYLMRGLEKLELHL